MDLLVFGKCCVCGVECLWMPQFDGVLSLQQVCSDECLDKKLEKKEDE